MGQSVEHFQVSTKRKVKVRVLKYNKLDSFSETLSQKAEQTSKFVKSSQDKTCAGNNKRPAVSNHQILLMTDLDYFLVINTTYCDWA